MLDEKTQIFIAMGYLSVFSLFGTTGNALVLYVFSRYKQKLTSTIFILTLAGVDFITCFITIPFTIVTEAINFQLKYDIICHIYYFLITSTVPFSAFLMVAIAVDRYLCIVYPFKHAMTIRRAEIIVGCLCAFAVVLGIICCYQHRVTPLSTHNISDVAFNASTSNASISENNTLTHVIIYQCQPQVTPFFLIYQKIYSSFFGVCAVIVIILYGLIYKSVLARRRKKLKVISNDCCGFWSSVPSFIDQTEITVLNNTEVTKDNEEARMEETCDKAVQKNGNAQVSDKDIILKPGGVSKAKLEKMRLANIKTAFMLSIVAFVFIVSFLPSWFTALNILPPANVTVFYLYFIYNVVNPVIYAFMNEIFREELRKRLCCQSKCC